jgi:hypothetical protein
VRPPLLVTFLAVLLIALATAGGAVMSAFRLPIQRYATERILAAPETHNLSGSRAYDLDAAGEIVFTIEAGLSFFHTHGEGMGVVLLFASTAVSYLVRRRGFRNGVNTILGLSFLFPIGYLAYSLFTLVYGKDNGITLAEEWLLIPFGSAAILGLVIASGTAAFALVKRRRDTPEIAGVAKPGGPPLQIGWRRPPLVVVFASALLILLAEIGGASMGRWTAEINAFSREWIRSAGPAHGLVGIKDVDDEIIDEALVKLDGGLRLFHLHAEGMGLTIFAGALVISSLGAAPGLKRILHGLLTIGGFGFPFGYLLWSGLIPPLGIDRARAMAAALALLPFGGAVLVAIGTLAVLLARDLCRVVTRPGASDAVSGVARAFLPPVSLVLASMLLLALAEVGGASMVKFKNEIERANRDRIEARADVHGLVGVRQVDGDAVDRTLARADFALRLFHLHAEGMALVIFAGGMMIRTFLAPRWLSNALYAMLAVGGFVYPFGYLAWSLMIPELGLQRSKDLAESLFWIPFGGTALAALGVVTVVLALNLLRFRRTVA